MEKNENSAPSLLQILADYIAAQGFNAEGRQYAGRTEMFISSQVIGDEVAHSIWPLSCYPEYRLFSLQSWFDEADMRIRELDQAIAEKREQHRQQFRQRYRADKDA